MQIFKCTSLVLNWLQEESSCLRGVTRHSLFFTFIGSHVCPLSPPVLFVSAAACVKTFRLFRLTWRHMKSSEPAGPCCSFS